MAEPPPMPDLSHLSAEERQIIEEVFQRQRAEEEKETQLSQKADQELEAIERQINERKEIAQRLLGTQDDAICQICQKTKFADGIGHKCFYCQLRSCARCGGRTTSRNKPIWACSLCQKRQQILAKTGKWFQQAAVADETKGTASPGDISPTFSTPRTPILSAGSRKSSTISVTAMRSNGPQSAGAIATATAGGAGPSSQTDMPISGSGPSGQVQHQQHQQQPQQQQSQLSQPSSIRQQPGLSVAKRQTTFLRQPTLETERRGSLAAPSSASQLNGSPKHRNDEHSSTSSVPDRRRSIHEAPSQGEASFGRNLSQRQHLQQPVSITRASSDRLLRSKSTADHDEGVTTIELDRPQLHPERSFDSLGQDRRYSSSRDVHERQHRESSFQSDNWYQSQPDGNIPEEDSRRRRRDMESVPQSEKGTASTSDSGGGAPVPLRTYDLDSSKRDTYSTTTVVKTSSRGAGGGGGGRSRSVRENESKKTTAPAAAVEEQVHPVPSATSSTFPTLHSGRRKTRLPRQLHSMSSSEDELPSTSNGNSAEEMAPRVDTEISSEKDILRYIYGSQKLRNGRKSGSDSKNKFQRSSEVSNVPTPQSTILPGDMLAAKIRTYLSHPVTWQPSADQRRLIGHMILQKSNGTQGDLGLKVVGGRRSDTGRLGAFITRVKLGSVADTVGRLRAGDEVLEWNGRPLQNATFDQVYEIINSSRHDSQVELIVSRSLSVPGGDDFLNVQRMLPNPSLLSRGAGSLGADYYLSSSLEPGGLSHSQSVTISPHMQSLMTAPSTYNAALLRKAPESSLYDVTGPSRVVPVDEHFGRQFGRGQIFGRIEISLCYGVAERQLIVTVRRALDLPPRPDGTARNPYVKLYLLPDRSEKSRRQSAVLVETCKPIWNEPFYYHGLTEPMLMERVLEVTVWDYDQYETNSFMGEVLIDFTIAQLDDEPFLYTLVDMDEENPLRARLQQRRLNAYHASTVRSRSEMGQYSGIRQQPGLADDIDYPGYETYLPAPRQQQQLMPPNYGMHRSRTYDRNGARVEEDWTVNSTSGYLSDHGYSNPLPVRYSHRERRPRSATAMRPLTDMRPYNRNLPPAPWSTDDDEGQQIPNLVAATAAGQAPARFARDPRSPNERLRLEAMQEQQQPGGGYGSDGSETLSVHSVQSIPTRRPPRRMPNGENEQIGMGQQIMENNVEEYIEEGAISDSVMAKGSAAAVAKDRKKSLMTRLIPGRNAPLEGKRTGFQRSEEVGVPEGLSVPGDYLQSPFTKQTSKESTDSSHSDNWGPILTDGPLGSFVDNLGPGQVVGRQVLASPVLGEIQIGIAAGRAGIDVEIIRAKNLVVKPGVKVNPAPYVKVYLLEGKQCVAKAKTHAVRRTTAPLFQQHIVFSESPRKKMLQITVMGDYGRMERKSFMGIAQIRLDDLELGPEPMIGWYKLYHSSSLAGTGPIRKDSDASLTEMRQ